MSNFLWYSCIFVISVLIAACAIYMNRDKYKISTYIVFYIFSSCITWIGEFTVLGFFNSYAYKTGLVEDQWAQNLLGHLLLNTSMYPAAATVMVAFSLSYGRSALVTTVIFVLAEYLFIVPGFYEQHWWKYYMSVITIILFLWISRKWFYKMNEKPYGLTRAVILYFVAMLIIHTYSPILLLLGKQYYQIGWINNLVGNMYRSSIIVIFLYHLLESFLIVVFVCVLKGWYWKLMPLIISPIVQIIFAKSNVLILQDGWKLIYTLFLYEIGILLFILVDRYALKPGS